MIPYNNGNTYKTLAAAKKAAGDNSFVAEYGVTTYDELKEAYDAGKHIILKFSQEFESGAKYTFTTGNLVYEGNELVPESMEFRFTVIYDNIISERRLRPSGWYMMSDVIIPSYDQISSIRDDLNKAIEVGTEFDDEAKNKNLLNNPKVYYNTDTNNLVGTRTTEDGYAHLTMQYNDYTSETSGYQFVKFNEYGDKSGLYYPMLFFSSSTPDKDQDVINACKQLIQMGVRQYRNSHNGHYPASDVDYLSVTLMTNVASLGNIYDLNQLFKQIHPEFDRANLPAIWDGEPYTRERMVAELSTLPEWNNRDNTYGTINLQIIKPSTLSWLELDPDLAYVSTDVINNNAIDIDLNWCYSKNILHIVTNDRSNAEFGETRKSGRINDVVYILKGGYVAPVDISYFDTTASNASIFDLASGTRPVGYSTGSASAGYGNAYRTGWNIYGQKGISWDEMIATATETSSASVGYTPSLPGKSSVYKKLAFEEDIPELPMSGFDVVGGVIDGIEYHPKEDTYVQIGTNNKGIGNVWFRSGSKFYNGAKHSVNIDEMVEFNKAVTNTTPTSDGNYVLKCTVTGGVPTYTWVAE